MAAAAHSTISVLRKNELVPLLASAQPRAQQPWSGVILERHAVRPQEIPEHEHRDFCFHLQVSGNSDFEWWSEGRHGVEATAPGSLILLAPGTRDRLRWEGDSERLILSLNPERLRQTAEEMDSSGEIEFSNRWSLQDSALANLMSEMGREASAGWPFGALYADWLESNLARHLLHRHIANPLPVRETKGRLPSARLRSVLEFINANLHRDLTVQEIAKQLELSAFHFAREFRNSIGQTPHQYVLDQRIERAKQLLRMHSMSVQEIAFEVGFGSPVNFIRAFRLRVGVTPGAWKDAT